MAEPKHTPGPWAVGEMHPDNQRTDKPAGPELAVYVVAQSTTAPGSEGHGHLVCRGMDGPTRAANARLIAAAPDLLEACEDVDAWFSALLLSFNALPDRGEAIRKSFAKLRAAIANARGGS